MKNILPPRLTTDKSIGIIAPATPVAGVLPREQIEKGYQYLRDRGFAVVEGESTKHKTNRHITPISMRINDIHEFVKRDDIGCIMSFWGGLNTNQLLEFLDYELIKNNPKIIIGFSDMTALTTAITKKTGLITFSGPAVISFAKPEPFEYTWEYFNHICISGEDAVRVSSSPFYADDLFYLREDDDHRIKKENKGISVYKHGKTKGEVVAGNLQTLLALSGTEYMPNMSGRILFLEDDETCSPALIDKFLRQCKMLGWFDKIAGLVLGRFTEQSKFSSENSLEDLLTDYFSKVEFPILYNVDFGHSDPMITIPNGGHVNIDSEEKEISFKQSVA